MTKIVRVGVTFPPELLAELDEIIDNIGYESRSKAIQDAVTLFVTEQKLLHKQEGKKAGVLVMVYDHDVKGLEDDLVESQHHHRSVINSVLHVHLSDKECLEAVAVKGDAKEIRKLAQELATRKGVKQVRSTIVSS
ncbi:MAG: nickel-responsive transcriptional regulator NikR [Candidatus Bathyarchaeota archaeon]|nr:nickel-responsive transcriptional regulator NikR [Candidatus Bathyarchaeum tardum]WGM88874.1 MAG: nickel-responsive transcriptional regulator NikR [Candidatus Bathyarchaeum tardum]WNZ28884.1 MAG: nickel-responsive transcriptional regulator NikR [Candidatus Bathyarchaeota archaeon]